MSDLSLNDIKCNISDSSPSKDLGDLVGASASTLSV